MISVIIPAYNEEKRISSCLLKIEEVLNKRGKEFEILVIDDGSQDQTARVVKSFENKNLHLLSYGENRGKGGAVKFGILKAIGETLVFTDADLPYPPEKILLAHEKICEGYDCVFGKKEYKENGQGYPFYRRVMSEVFGWFVRLILHIKQKDTQCGFKAFKKEAAKEIFDRVTLSGFGFDAEIVFLAEKRGKKIFRLPVELFHEKKGSKIHIFQDTFTMLKDLFEIRSNEKKGRYI